MVSRMMEPSFNRPSRVRGAARHSSPQPAGAPAGWHGQVRLPVRRATSDTGTSTCPCHPETFARGGFFVIALLLALASPVAAQDKKGGKTAAAEAEYYKVIEIPIPESLTLEVGALECMP